jgi:hypothetical protein
MSRAVLPTPFPWCRTEIEISGGSVEGHTTICIRTGAACMQTYATRDELRALAEMLLQHANENEVLEVTG